MAWRWRFIVPFLLAYCGFLFFVRRCITPYAWGRASGQRCILAIYVCALTCARSFTACSGWGDSSSSLKPGLQIIQIHHVCWDVQHSSRVQNASSCTSLHCRCKRGRDGGGVGWGGKREKEEKKRVPPLSPTPLPPPRSPSQSPASPILHLLRRLLLYQWCERIYRSHSSALCCFEKEITVLIFRDISLFPVHLG